MWSQEMRALTIIVHLVTLMLHQLTRLRVNHNDGPVVLMVMPQRAMVGDVALFNKRFRNFLLDNLFNCVHDLDSWLEFVTFFMTRLNFFFGVFLRAL